MFTSAHEVRQTPTGSAWSESHRLVAVDGGRATAVAMQVSVKKSAGRQSASFHCAVFRFGQPPIVVAEAEIAAPSARWEFRTSGLWADTICETPLQHWSYGLEAFGLEISDPAELLGRGYGDRVPLGWELEFESDSSEVEPAAGSSASRGEREGEAPDSVFGYCQRGEAHGLLLDVAGESEFVGRAVRQHWWGSAEPTSFARVLTGLDEQITETFAGPLGTIEAPGAEVALPLAVSDGEPVQWWLTGSAAGLRSRTVLP